MKATRASIRAIAAPRIRSTIDHVVGTVPIVAVEAIVTPSRNQVAVTPVEVLRHRMSAFPLKPANSGDGPGSGRRPPALRTHTRLPACWADLRLP